MAQLKDLLVDGKSRFIDKIYASDQFISKVAQGTSPFVVDSSTLVSNLNADLVDGQHFTYSNTNNTPTYLWGTSANGTNYLVSRANMHMGISDKLVTVKRETDAWHFPTFVDSNNTTATEESFYTDWGLAYNPSKRSLAIGWGDYTLVTAGSSVTIGVDNAITAACSLAVGDNACVNAYGSFAQGLSAVADGEYSSALGYHSNAGGFAAHAEGGYVKDGSTYSGGDASGDAAHAEGARTNASGTASHAEGDRTTASGTASHAEGINTTASEDGAHAEGYGTNADEMDSHAEGSGTNAYGFASHAEGFETTAGGDYSHSEGYKTNAGNEYSHAEGYKTIASGEYSHTEGTETKATRSHSHAEGYHSQSTGLHAHAEGSSTLSSGNRSHAEGNSTISSGYTSHAEGHTTTASGEGAHSEGKSTSAGGDNAHAEGEGTSASGHHSHAEGMSTRAQGSSSHAEGHATWATGQYSHAEGDDSSATGSYSHAGGNGSIASGTSSFAHGLDAQATNNRSFAIGEHTRALHINEFAMGRYNLSNPSTIFSIGNGSSDSNRSNLFSIDGSSNNDELYLYFKSNKFNIYFDGDMNFSTEGSYNNGENANYYFTGQNWYLNTCDGNTHNFEAHEYNIFAKQFYGDLSTNYLVPIKEKTYANYTCSAADTNSGYIFFAKVVPTDASVWQKPWRVHYTLDVDTSVNECHGLYDVFIGYSGSTVTYHIFNRFYSTSYRPLYYHVAAYHNTAAKFSSYRTSQPVRLGARVTSAYGANTVARTYRIRIWEEYNCTVSFPNSIETYGNVYNTTYYALSELPAYNQGLAESWDDNDTTTTQFYYVKLKAGTNGMKQYSLVMMDASGNWQSFITDSGTGPTHTKNAVGFVLGSPIYYMNMSGNIAAGSYNGYGAVRPYQSLVDFRYSFSGITANGTGLTADKPLYVVGTIGTDGLFYLDDDWKAQDIPTTENGKIYIKVSDGIYQDYSGNANGSYRGDLISRGYAYWYKNGKIQRYNHKAEYATHLGLIKNTNWSTAASLEGNGLAYYVDTTTEGRPFNYGSIFQFSNSEYPIPGTDQNWVTQILSGTDNTLWVRWRTNTGSWSAAQKLVTEATINRGYIGTTAVKATSGAGQDLTGIGTVYIQGTQGTYREGIRIKPYSSWSTIVLGGTDLTADSGTSTKSWGIFNNDGSFYLTKGASSSAASSGGMFSNVSGKWQFNKGNVGIAMTPTEALDVSGNLSVYATASNATLSIDTNLKIGTARRNIHIITNSGSGTGINDGNVSGITFGANNSTAYAGIYTQSSGGYGNRLIFATTNSFANGAYARMIIDNNGKVGIATLTPTQALDVSGNITANLVYANRNSSGTTGGVSLYGSSLDYGIYFRTTAANGAEWGKLGRVQSDWATFLTMNDTSTRGWIFKRGTASVASIAGNGEAYFSATGHNMFIAYPNGGSYSPKTSSLTGAVAIKLPKATYKSTTMMKFTVDIFNYATGTSVTYVVSGYNYSTPSWENVTAYSLRQGTDGHGNLPVQFGWDSSLTRNIIWIGNTTTTWSYIGVYVRDLGLGFNNVDYNKWSQGWEISVDASLGVVNKTVNNPATNYVAESAGQVKTEKRTTNATHYLTFVDSNNDSSTAELVYTSANLSFNPSTSILNITSASGMQKEVTVSRTGGSSISLMVGTGNTNHGLYSITGNKWMIYADASGNVTVNGNAATATSASSATTSSKVKTVASTATGNYYLTFVDSNNSTAADETVYTSAKLYIQPSTGNIYSSGKVFVNNTTTAMGADSTSVIWWANSSGYPLVASANVVRRGASLATGQLGDASYPWAALYTKFVYIDSSAVGNTAHIQFNRASYNYIQIPTGGTLSVNINGAGSANSYFKVDASGAYPGDKHETQNLGSDSIRWNNLYAKTWQLPNNAILEDASGRVGIGAKPSHSSAKGLNVGDLLVSNAWADRSKIPTNGIYSKGQIKIGVAQGTAPLAVDSSTLNSNLNADYLDGEHLYELRSQPKNNSYIIFSSLPFLESGIGMFSSTPAVSMENAPEGLCYGPITSYKQYTSDFIAVEPGETVYGEIWAYRASGATGTAGTLYYGIQRYDRNKKPISANAGLNAPTNGYFVCSGTTVPADGTWHKYSNTHTIPTSHTVYSGSDGKGVYYVKVYVLVNYSAGTIPTYIGRFLLSRKVQSAVSADTATSAGTIDGILPISKGGTDASTAAGARANLGTWSLVSDSYNTLMPADGTTNAWVKIGKANTSYGILPSQSGARGSGHNYIGTSSWYWKYAYIDEMYISSMNINNKLVIDNSGRIIPYDSSTSRAAGNYGYYDSHLLGHIWSIGTSYSISANGKSPNTLYGLAYFHTNWSNDASYNDGTKTARGTYAGGHQVAWFNNGVLASAMGDNFYTKGQFISKKAQGTAPLVVDSSTVVTNLNADLLDGNHASAFLKPADVTGVTSLTLSTTLQTYLTVGSTNYQIKLPDTIPWTVSTTDTKVTQTITTSSNTSWRGLLLSGTWSDAATFAPDTSTTTSYIAHLGKFAPATGILAVVGMNKMKTDGTVETGSNTSCFNTNGGVTTVLTSHQTIKQNGITGATRNCYASCTTAAGTPAKTANVTSGTPTLEAGLKVSVKFSNKNTANSPTLNINSTGAKNIFHNGAQITSGTNKGMLYGIVDFVYDGTQWCLVGNYVDTDTNTTPTVSTNTAGTYYLVFVDSNNSSSAAETLYTSTYICVNPGKKSLCCGVDAPIPDASGSINFGTGGSVTGAFSYKEGQYSTVAALGAHAEGHSNDISTNANYSHVEGDSNHIYGKGLCAHGEGCSNTIDASYAHAEGYGSSVLGQGAHAEGHSGKAKGIYSHTEGQNTTSWGSYAHSEGSSSTQAPAATADGSTYAQIKTAWDSNKFSIAFGSDSHSEGQDSVAFGSHSHTEGCRTIAVGDSAHAEGHTTTASGAQSHAEGYVTTALGSFSHAGGIRTKTIGEGSFAHGYADNEVPSTITSSSTLSSIETSWASTKFSLAFGTASQSVGYNTLAGGNYSFASGKNTKATGTDTFTSGQGTVASGNHSHAEGCNTTASADSAHAEGHTTYATGNYSHAGGQDSSAATSHSFVHGLGLMTPQNSEATCVVGKYNDWSNMPANTWFSVGNGTSNSARSNAFDINGVSGSVHVTAYGTMNANGYRTIPAADASLSTTVAIGENKLMLLQTSGTAALTVAFTWSNPLIGEEAHLIITGTGSSKTITIGNVNSSASTTKKNVSSIKVTSGGYGEISILYLGSYFFIRAAGN